MASLYLRSLWGTLSAHEEPAADTAPCRLPHRGVPSASVQRSPRAVRSTRSWARPGDAGRSPWMWPGLWECFRKRTSGAETEDLGSCITT